MVGSSSIAPMVLPQVLQKARLEYEEDRQIEGLPPGPTHSTFCAENSTHVRVSEPECLRQFSHEHVCGLPGSPVTRNLIEPQMQPPSNCLVFISRLRQKKMMFAWPNVMHYARCAGLLSATYHNDDCNEPILVKPDKGYLESYYELVSFTATHKSLML